MMKLAIFIKRNGFNKINKNGFTFIQLMVSIGIAGIILAAALPNFSRMMNSAKLEKASENFSSYLMWAKSKANNGDQVHLVMTAGNNWCYGLHSASGCNCSSPGSCSYLQEDADNYDGISMTNNSGVSQHQFSDNSGATSNSLEVTFTNSDNTSITIRKNQVGMVTVCSDDINHYSGC